VKQTTSAFIPKASIPPQPAGLLTRSLSDGLPVSISKQWHQGSRKVVKELTAAGTVPEFHRIPF